MYEEYQYFKSEMEKYNKEYAEAMQNKTYNEDELPGLLEAYNAASKNAIAELKAEKEVVRAEYRQLIEQIDETLTEEYLDKDDYCYIYDILKLLCEGTVDTLVEAKHIAQRCSQCKRKYNCKIVLFPNCTAFVPKE